MPKFGNAFIGLTALALLASCSSATQNDRLDFSTITYGVHDALELSLVARGARDSNAGTPFGQLPMSDTAKYVGTFELEEFVSGQSDNDIAGQLDVAVSLSEDTFEGTVTEIAGRDGGQFAGELAIAGGSVTRSIGATPTINANVDGEIENQFGVVVIVDADIAGRFTGNSGQFIDGLVTGTMTRDGTVIAIGDGDFS